MATTSHSILPHKGQEVRRQLPIEPSLSLRARIITLRDLPPGQPVGYGARFVTDRPSRIAVINAGYADGILASERIVAARWCAAGMCRWWAQFRWI